VIAMTITAIKQQIKNLERVSVFIDGKYSFSLSLDELVTHKIKNNDELSEADVKRLKKISTDGKLKARTLEWVLNRPHSVREFGDYLRRKKAEPDLIEKWTEEFTGKKYLDDYAFAGWLYELRVRVGKSNRAIQAEFFKKGIARDIIDTVLEESTDDEAKRIKLLIAKKRRLSRYKNNPEKLAQYLTSQGFSYGLVKESLRIDQPD
jgi:regulatory protein